MPYKKTSKARRRELHDLVDKQITELRGHLWRRDQLRRGADPRFAHTEDVQERMKHKCDYTEDEKRSLKERHTRIINLASEFGYPPDGLDTLPGLEALRDALEEGKE